MNISEFKTQSINQLKNTSPSAQLDVEVFLLYALNFSRTQLLLKKDEEIPPQKLEWLLAAVEKRKTGLPVAYITGHKEFYGYDFFVNPSVLIPKPDTEILVERAVELVIEKMDARPNQLLTVCDMCTGSGCIALAVYKTLKEVYKIADGSMPKFTLVDISSDALEVAKQNAKNLDCDVRFARSNLFDVVPGSFDLILTNPPYIPATLVDELLQDGRNEPRLALDGDVDEYGTHTKTNDGLDLIRRLIPQMKQHLAPMGTVLMEAGEYNAKAAASIAENYGFKTEILKDLEGQLRVVEIRN